MSNYLALVLAFRLFSLIVLHDFSIFGKVEGKSYF